MKTQTKADAVPQPERVEIARARIHISRIVKDSAADPWVDWQRKSQLLVDEEDRFTAYRFAGHRIERTDSVSFKSSDGK